MNLGDIIEKIPEAEEEIIEMHKKLTMIPSWDASHGEVTVSRSEGGGGIITKGDGGLEKTNFIQKQLEGINYFDRIERYDAKDSAGNPVPILVAVKNGVDTEAPTLWFAGHTDTVTQTVKEGDYTHKPLKAQVITLEDGRKAVQGLGTEDNNQAIIELLMTSGILAAHEYMPQNNIGMLFFGREELGSADGGARTFLEEVNPELGLIRQGDVAVVPDAPSDTGGQLYLQEGHIQEIKVEFYHKPLTDGGEEGLSYHVFKSQPHGHENPVVAMAEMILWATHDLEEELGFEWLNKEADDAEMYDGLPGQSTRTTINPTTLYENQKSTNQIAGSAKVSFDNRYIAEDSQDPAAVFARFEEEAKVIADEYNLLARVTHGKDTPYFGATKRTDLVYKLMSSVLDEMGIEQGDVAIKAGTFGRFFQIAGASALACGKSDGTEHCKHEYSVIKDVYFGVERNLRAIATPLADLADPK